MRLVITIACAFAVLGCSKKLSKEAALEMLNRTGTPMLECNTIIAGLDYDPAGMQFYRDDSSGCAKKLEKNGFLTNVECYNKTRTERFAGENVQMPLCTASLAKGARFSGHGKLKVLLFPCGNAHYVIQSLVTEGRHATVQYGVGIEQTILTDDTCAVIEPGEGGSFKASLDDDGNWIMDGPPR